MLVGNNPQNASDSAHLISQLFNQARVIPEDLSSNCSSLNAVKQDVRPLIDPKFVDNPELSDIRFRVQGKVVHAHRIVLVNASDRFRELLKSPSGVVELDDVSHAVFKVGNDKNFMVN